MRNKKVAILALSLGVVFSLGFAACGGKKDKDEVKGETLADEAAWTKAIEETGSATNATIIGTATYEERMGEYFMKETGEIVLKVADGKLYQNSSGTFSGYYPDEEDGSVVEKNEPFEIERYIGLENGVAVEYFKEDDEDWFSIPYDRDDPFVGTLGFALTDLDLNLEELVYMYAAFENEDGTYIFESTDEDDGENSKMELKFVNGKLYSYDMESTYIDYDEESPMTVSMDISLVISYGNASVGELPETEKTPDDSNSGDEEMGSGSASEGLDFTLNQGQTSYSVTGRGSCEDTEIVIPATYEELPVTAVGNSAFLEENITSVVLPDSVKQIGLNAFMACGSLETISIYGEDVSIGNEAFKYCTQLKEVVFLGSVTSIDTQAFYSCGGLIEIEFPVGLTTLGGQAFSDCSNLKGVVLPDGLKEIGDDAFSYCRKLESIVIPDSVETIGQAAFLLCESLKEVSLPNGLGNILQRTFENCSSLTEIVIPDSVTVIYWTAFLNCTNLTNVTIGSGITKIEGEAFDSCTKLENLEFNGTIEQWGLVIKETWWNRKIAAKEISCLDGKAQLFFD